MCDRCCVCVTPAQPQREDSGPAVSKGREPVGAGCGPPRLVSVQGPTESKDASLKAGLTLPNEALGSFSTLPPQRREALRLGSQGSFSPSVS